jgi:hypothetical protein
MTTMIAMALAQAATLADMYLAAVRSICSYQTWLLEQGSLGESHSDEALTAAKSGAANWYASIFPESLAVRDGISRADATICSEIRLLGALSTQLRHAPALAPIRAEIIECAGRIAKVVGDANDRCTALSTAINGALASIAADHQRFATIRVGASIEARELSASIMRLKGQLDAEKRAPCPNHNKLRSIAEALVNKERAQGVAGRVLEFMDAARDHTNEAERGGYYLSDFWSSITNQTRLAAIALKVLQTKPDQLANTDIETAYQKWHLLVEELLPTGSHHH